MHAAAAYEPHPLWFKIFCMAVILSGKQQNGDTTRAYSVSCSSRTPDANMRSPYGDNLPINSCDWSRAYYVITIMASNTQLTTVRDREPVKFISSFR